MGERTVYRNLWYGLTLEHPAGWQVRQAPGCVVISPDAASITCAAVRFFAADPGLSLRQVAEQVVGLIRRADPGVRAWTEQPEDGITVHLSATVNGTPVRGWTLLQAKDGSVMATGLQAPAGELAERAPVLGEILASLRFENPPPLRHIAAGALSRERPGVRVGEVVAEPEFAAIERAQSTPGIPTQVESASIVLTYDQGGVLYREAVTATLVRLMTMGSWTARIAARRRAPARRYSEADTIFCGILQSIAPDPDWARNEQARVGQVLGEAMGRNAQAQSDLANAVRHLGQVRRDGAAGLADGAMRHFNAFSREQELHMMPTLRGVYRTTDPNAPPVIGANRLEPI